MEVNFQECVRSKEIFNPNQCAVNAENIRNASTKVASISDTSIVMSKTSGAVILFWQGREDVEEVELEDAFTFFCSHVFLILSKIPFYKTEEEGGLSSYD